MATNRWIELPAQTISVAGSVNAFIFDSLGNSLTSTAGSLNVNVTNSAAPAANIGLNGAPIPLSSNLNGAKDGSGNLQPLTISAGALQVGGSLSISNFPATVAVTQSTSPWIVDGSGFTQPVSGTFFQATQPVSAASLPLPTGASTSANQVTELASLASIDSKLTSPLTVTGPLTDAQLRATPVPVSGTITTSPDVNVHDGAGVSISSTGSSLNINVTNFPATQPVSGTVAVTQSTSPWIVNGSGFTQPISAAALPLPAGAATSANQTTELASLASIDSKLTSPLTVTGPLTDAQLRATPVPVSGTVAFSNTTIAVTQSTSPWVVSGSIGSSNDTNYGTVGANTLRTAAQIGNATGAALFGAGTTTAQVLRVVLPTDQTAIPVTGTFFQATQPVSGTVTVNQGTSPWVTSSSNFPTTLDTNYGAVGSSTLRTASQIGNATGAALFGAGTTTAQVLRVVLPTDQTAIPASQSGAWSVTANAGTNLNTSALALESSLVKLPLTQGSTTSGQSGVLTQGAVTTAAPAYTTGQTSPLSLTTGGALRVDSSGSTQPVSGTVTANLAQTTFVTGAKSSISTSAVQITATSTTLKEGVTVKAASANTGTVYVGLATVTNGTTDATDGFEIKSGESVTIEVDNPNKVYVIASAASQKVFWVGV